MYKILLLRSENAFLPEIDAYIDYFQKTSEFIAYDSSKIKDEYSINDFDVIWEFKGVGGIKSKNHILIHDYASLSTGSLAKVKNLAKKMLNYKPNLRIFLNEFVQKEFKFNDNIDYCYRDMGINEAFLNVNNNYKEYDFVYTGSISKSRNMDKLLKKFNNNNIGKICLVGNVDDDIYNEYKYNKDIIFTGKVDYLDVPNIASKAIYGLNFIPDKYPYNLQTSTKLLEYLALGLNIVTTDYKWAREFERMQGCSFYKIDSKDIDINMKDIENYEFVSNFNEDCFLWDNIIKKSDIEKKILLNIK